MLEGLGFDNVSNNINRIFNELLADDVHYNETGADFIASRYYEVLNEVLQR
jgi:lysophospholipase L1-like esterase